LTQDTVKDKVKSEMEEKNKGVMPLGTKAPEFNLQDVKSGEFYTLEDFLEEKVLLVMFLSHGDPYTQHIGDGISKLADYYEGSGVSIVAISSNDAENYEEDSPGGLREMSEEFNFYFPILYDQSQETARDYTVIYTPDFFVFNEKGELAYHGQFDDARPGNDLPVTGKDLRDAIDALLSGKAVSKNQKPANGTDIKWKPGNEPL